MRILAVNAGSSSLKFQMYEMPEEKVLISGYFERIGLSDSFYTIKKDEEKNKKIISLHDHNDAVKLLIEELFNYKVISTLSEIKGVGHRVVHGGDKYSKSVIIDDEVINTVEELIPLAPLHNPANLMGIKAFNESIKECFSVAVFDTAFHQTMPKVSYIYGTPYEWYTDYGVRKYGFHGTSHNYITDYMKEKLNNSTPNLITCHLGNGVSITAVKEGESYDTSMGFGPNAGLIMGTRSGDIDTAIIPYMMDKKQTNLEDIMDELNKKSGYLGISGISSDSRDIEEGILKGDERAILAQDLYVRRIVEYIAKYYVLLGRIDAICFAGGIGENAIMTREKIINSLKVLGIELNTEANKTIGKFKLLTTNNSKISCYIVPTDEEVMIAREVYEFLK